MLDLPGKVAIVTGAGSIGPGWGNGKATAVLLARQGAKVFAVDVNEDAAEETRALIEEEGGECVTRVCDMTQTEEVKAAVDACVERFGGIDILVNNASAISLTGTLETPMKKFDLMFGVNVRGTYATTQACLPELLKAKNPHVLTLSPPLNMKPKWFENHVAYTMAKYGMSMCVLGMAEEFRDRGVAFNALWPRTVIATAAINMIGGQEMMEASRTPEIMADAAHVILTRDSRSSTGNFFIDEDLLRETGVKEFSKYLVKPGTEPLQDFFLD
jgi:citronellol/citronellal dehydrogenase